MPEMVNHPRHYAHPSGIECIEITRLCHGDLSAAIQYIWRYDAKGTPEQDLRKARWYLRDILANGLASHPPYKAKEMLLDVIAADRDPLRTTLLYAILHGELARAIERINDEVGADA